MPTVGVGPAGTRLLEAGALVAASDLAEVAAITIALARGEPGRVVACTAVEVLCLGEDPALSPASEASVARAWEAALTQHPGLTDGEILTLRTFPAAGPLLCVEAGLTRYADRIICQDYVMELVEMNRRPPARGRSSRPPVRP